jgi:flagellin-like protein
MGELDIRGLLTEEEAVSPVIGIVLMVAITVILASIVGVFAFDVFGQNSQETPSVIFEYDYDGTDDLTIRHRSGAVIKGAAIEFKKRSGTPLTDWSSNTEVQAGDSIELGPSSSPSTAAIDPGDTVLIVWNQQEQGEDTAVIGTWEGPDA